MRSLACLAIAAIVGGAVLPDRDGLKAVPYVMQSPGQRRGPTTPPPSRTHDPAIETLVADAALVPPEFGADALIRISQFPKVDSIWRREMLDDAYMRAYAAPEQYRKSTTLQVPADSRQGAQLFANATALTRLTLQIRVVQLMIVVDPLRARELFEWLELNLAPGNCADPLVPAVDDYYNTLSLLARTGFRNRADALMFLELYLYRAHLPSEMPSVARAIQRFRPNNLEAPYLEGMLRQLLQGSSKDAIGFSSAALDEISRMTDLQIYDTSVGVIGSNVMDALRSYLLDQLKAPRCGDNPTAALIPTSFNAAARRARAEFDVKPMDADAARLPTLLGTMRIDPYWQTANSARLHDAAVKLRGPGAVPVSLRVRRTIEWRNQAEALLVEIERWSPASESTERDYFYQKAVLYNWLLDLMPASVVRSRALRSYVEFLRRGETDVSQRALWFAFVNRLLEMANGPYRADTLSAMEESQQPTLWLYARLERQMPERKP